MAEEKPHLALNQSVLLHRVWGLERVGERSPKLGDSATNSRYIITEPRVGYRMAGAGTGQRANDGTELSITEFPEQSE